MTQEEIYRKALELIVNSEEHEGDSFVCDFQTLQGVARQALAQQPKTSEHEAKDDQIGCEIGCGGWQIVSDLLHGEKLLDSTNEAIYGLCAGNSVVVKKHPAAGVELTDAEIVEVIESLGHGSSRGLRKVCRAVISAHEAKRNGGGV